MNKIIPYLWFDTQALEAAELYTSIFPNSKITHSTTLHNTPSGDTQVVSFEILGRDFQAISAGPVFKLNPAVSFQVTCTAKEEVDRIWERLADGGQVLMELGSYPYSERYGWLQDRYGLSWQLIYDSGERAVQKLAPVLMFVGDVCGRAEEAINYWTTVFTGGKANTLQRYGKDEEPEKVGTLKFGSFSLFGQEFGAMDSAYAHQFGFNEAISFLVNCSDQDEIDYYWSKLSVVPEAEVCGWLKDKYGFSWQIVPERLQKMLTDGDQKKVDRVTQAFLVMKKLDIAKLQDAYIGN
jgi:predicted 3-demethylubiquinone-9 3-methyltransferase (glyoxalase superfamily)